MRHVSRTDPRAGKRLDWRRRGGSWTGRWPYRNRETNRAVWGLAVGDAITDNGVATGALTPTTQHGRPCEEVR